MGDRQRLCDRETKRINVLRLAAVPVMNPETGAGSSCDTGPMCAHAMPVSTRMPAGVLEGRRAENQNWIRCCAMPALVSSGQICVKDVVRSG